MFLGTFNYEELTKAAPMTALIYFYSYMVLFRYLIVNMFLAILDKHFTQEDAEREKRMKVQEAQRKERDLDKKVKEKWSSRLQIGNLFGRSKSSVKKQQPEMLPEEDDAGEKAAVPPAVAPVTPTSPVSPNGNVAMAEDDMGLAVGTEEEEALVEAMPPTASQAELAAAVDAYDKEVCEGKVTNQNWHYLPQEMKNWAVHTSRGVYADLEVWKAARVRAEEPPTDRSDLDQCLEEIETQIKDKGKEKRMNAIQARNDLNKMELLKLQEVHKDQESLAWYIMKRESELKRLEKTRAEKQKRIDEMRSAANSLINNEVAEDGAMRLTN
jgi:hypothetical protein